MLSLLGSYISNDPVVLFLALGVIVSIVSLIAIASGRGDQRKRRVGSPRPATTSSPMDKVAVTPARVRAEAAARVRTSEAAAQPRSHTLEGVKPARPRTAQAGGQQQATADGSPQDQRARQAREASARAAAEVAFHVAEHDPQRMAEVITQWIRSQDNPRKNGAR